MSNAEPFKQDMRRDGIEPPATIIMDGRKYRFHVKGDKPGSKNGWYKYYGNAGSYGCFKRGIVKKWRCRTLQSLTTKDKIGYNAEIEKGKRQHDEEQELLHAKCREKASSIWESANKNGIEEHSYSVRKGIKPSIARTTKNGKLVIPVRDINWLLHGLQFISKDGTKKFMSNTAKRGNFALLGKRQDITSELLICEGWATGCSLRQATKLPVVVAFDAGNLKAVAEAWRHMFLKIKIIIAGDDDHATKGNPGRIKATEAAKAVKGIPVFPDFVDASGKTDFNDMHQEQGLSAVKSLIMDACSSYLGISDESAKDKSNLDTALEIVDGIKVFLDQYGEPFVFHDGHCSSLKSREIRALISREIYASTKKAPKQSNLTEVLATLESKALFEGEKIELHLRIAWHKNFIWYDLGNKMAVRVGRKGWEIVDAPVLFRRYSHQQEQVTPIKGGNAWQLFDFLNIAKKHQLETLVLLISYLVPDIAHPIFHPHGAQGSGKTTLCKLIKRLIDPSSLEVIFMPRDKNELIRQINRHHVPLFDNMSRLDYEQSDILCMSCTGGGIAKRVLYTDDDDRIYNFMRCIGLNGVNLLVTKPDILDRTMLIELERISPSERKLEAQLWREFNDAKPEILGGMFDTLTKAKAIFPSVKLAELPRLADFAKWGYAIAEALEKGLGKQFIADYQANVRRQNAEVLQSNNLCLAVTQFMRAREQWEGTVKTAYELLHQIVEPSKTDDTFPRDPKNLRKNLAYIQTTLAESEHITYRVSAKAKKDGYHIEFMKHK